jgi:hypothetical protein
VLYETEPCSTTGICRRPWGASGSSCKAAMRTGDRQYVGILQAVPLYRLEAVETAWGKALGMGAFSKELVLNLQAHGHAGGVRRGGLQRPQAAGDPGEGDPGALKAEAAEHRLRSIRYRRAQVRFPMIKDLDRFRFVDCPVNEAQIRSLYEGGFFEAHSNLIFGGGTGTGKTHLAIAMAAKPRAPWLTSPLLQPHGPGQRPGTRDSGRTRRLAQRLPVAL